MPSTSGFCSSTASNACVGVSNKRQPSAVQGGSGTAATRGVDPTGAAEVIGGAGAGAAAGGGDGGAGSAPDGCDPAQPLPSTQQARDTPAANLGDRKEGLDTMVRHSTRCPA